MAPVAALLDSRGALTALRRTMPRGGHRIVACRSADGLRRVLGRRVLDAVVVGLRAMRSAELLGMRVQFPALPVVAYGVFRPDDGELLFRLAQPEGVAAIAVEGVDDSVVGELVWSQSLSQQRRFLLADAPRLLRLSEQLQQQTWQVLLADGWSPLRSAELARRLGLSREHLSRQFGAGGAPNLKRVIDLMRVVSAAQLLANPGYSARDVARLLGFASQSHLGATSRRIAGIPAAQLGAAGPRVAFEAFVRDGARGRSRT
jgi:AraC-like DNA-binding protein